MRRTPALLIALLLVLGGAACGDDADAVTTDDPTVTDDQPGATEPGVAGTVDDPLADREFQVVDVSGHELAAPFTLTFAEGQVAVAGGCNQLSGTYSLEGVVLVVEGLGGTEMACDQPLMDQDAWITAFLTDRPVLEPSTGEATALVGGEVTVHLTREAPEPPAELVGTAWTLDTITTGTDDDGTAASLPVGVTAGITFAADGTYTIESGCNTGSGTYAEAGAGIYQIDAPALTRRRCDGAAMDVEQAVLAVLDGEVTASIEADRLTLDAADGGLGFAAA